VVRVSKYCDERIRNQYFHYDAEIHEPEPFKSQLAFMQFLKTQHIQPQRAASPFTFTTFIEVANDMAKSMKDTRKHFLSLFYFALSTWIYTDFAREPLLVFHGTGNKAPCGHVSGSQCKPDITAAFDIHWQEDKTSWPCLRFAGQQVSKGKSKEFQKEQAVSYLHYLLLARPDLRVAQGMLTSRKGVTFLLGIEGDGIRSLLVTWKSSNLPELMYAFIYRLYRPEHFADPSYKLKADVANNSVEYSIRISSPQMDTIECPGFSPLFASNPFETRTHVLSNPLSEVKVNNKNLTMIKDQLCRVNSRFDERSILDRIHQTVKVPGVVEVVHSEIIETPSMPKALSEGRRKHRMGLRQSGNPFMSIPTVRILLETLFDVLEGNSDSIGRPRDADKFASAAVFASRAQNFALQHKQL
jgi:hypothetical protein